jgi:bifunctional lysine-specific demethylase and histidyl-hydroxylase NO66
VSPEPLRRLAALLEPIGLDAFFERYWERAPLHLAAHVEPLLDHDELVRALAGRAAPPDGFMAFPEHLDRDPELGPLDQHGLLRDPEILDAYVEAGHPIVWSRARGVFPRVDAMCAALSEAFGAHVWPNVYATGSAGTPFEMHFDCHEVLAVQCQGDKAWTISEVRVDRPIDASEMEPIVRATIQGRRAEAEARPLLRFTARPGSVVYIPRGQFHNAKAGTPRSLHVTFGLRLLTGHDVAVALARLAMVDPELREYLPPAATDREGGRATARIEAIRARLGALLSSPDLDRAIAEAHAYAALRSRSS